MSLPIILAMLFVLGLGVGVGVGLILAIRQRQRRHGISQAGITVSEMLQHVVSLVPIGVVVIDAHRDVVFANNRSRELGVVRDRQLDERAWKAVQRTLATGEYVGVDLSSPQRSSTSRSKLSVRGHVWLLTPDDPRFAVVYLDDQSEQARMEASRRDFVANVSHELKTPVAAMGILAEALLESANDENVVRHFGEKILAESQRLANMVGELIELSRLQGAEPLPELGEADVDDVVSEVISRHKIAAGNANITITTDAPSGLRVLGDQTLLVTALANLVANAIAYSPQGSNVSVSRRRRDDMVEIAVTDRGIGIAEADQERVFERFFRVDKARSRATGGTGLGLAIVKHVAANHNGSITLWSQPDTGSTFTLSVPVYSDKDSQHRDDMVEGSVVGNNYPADPPTCDEEALPQ